MTTDRRVSTLSLCMIVKNEEKFLPECLESVKGVVDQMVIVDTGSTDNTINIAKKFGAEVYNFKWCNDFSLARNESIKYATGEWIFWIDADERLINESIPELKRLLRFEDKPVIYSVQIRNIKADNSYSLSSAHRLFTNHKGIHFTGKIHEQVSPSAAKLFGEERKSKVQLYHLGYGVQGEEAEKKNQRNKILLERMVQESPNNAYSHYTLGQHYGLTGKNIDALQQYKIAFKLNQFDAEMNASLLNTMSESLMKLGRMKEAINKAKQSIKLKPIQAGGYYLLYKISSEKGEDNEAILWLKKLLHMTHRLQLEEKTISTDILIDENKIRFTIGELYMKLEEPDQALTFLKKIYHSDSENIQVIEKIAAIYFEKGNYHQAEEYIIHLNNLMNDNNQYLELLGVVLIKQKKYQKAISVYENIYSSEPENSDVMKKLIGLYGKVNEFFKAKELMVVYNREEIVM